MYPKKTFSFVEPMLYTCTGHGSSYAWPDAAPHVVTHDSVAVWGHGGGGGVDGASHSQAFRRRAQGHIWGGAPAKRDHWVLSGNRSQWVWYDKKRFWFEDPFLVVKRGFLFITTLFKSSKSYRSVLSNWEFVIKMRAAFLALSFLLNSREDGGKENSSHFDGKISFW